MDKVKDKGWETRNEVRYCHPIVEAKKLVSKEGESEKAGRKEGRREKEEVRKTKEKVIQEE